MTPTSTKADFSKPIDRPLENYPPPLDGDDILGEGDLKVSGKDGLDQKFLSRRYITHT